MILWLNVLAVPNSHHLHMLKFAYLLNHQPGQYCHAKRNVCMPGASAKWRESVSPSPLMLVRTWRKPVPSATFSLFLLYFSLFLHDTHISTAWAIHSLLVNVSFQCYLLHLQDLSRQQGANPRYSHSSKVSFLQINCSRSFWLLSDSSCSPSFPPWHLPVTGELVTSSR